MANTRAAYYGGFCDALEFAGLLGFPGPTGSLSDALRSVNREELLAFVKTERPKLYRQVRDILTPSGEGA